MLRERLDQLAGDVEGFGGDVLSRIETLKAELEQCADTLLAPLNNVPVRIAATESDLEGAIGAGIADVEAATTGLTGSLNALAGSVQQSAMRVQGLWVSAKQVLNGQIVAIQAECQAGATALLAPITALDAELEACSSEVHARFDGAAAELLTRTEAAIPAAQDVSGLETRFQARLAAFDGAVGVLREAISAAKEEASQSVSAIGNRLTAASESIAAESATVDETLMSPFDDLSRNVQVAVSQCDEAAEGGAKLVRDPLLQARDNVHQTLTPIVASVQTVTTELDDNLESVKRGVGGSLEIAENSLNQQLDGFRSAIDLLRSAIDEAERTVAEIVSRIGQALDLLANGLVGQVDGLRSGVQASVATSQQTIQGLIDQIADFKGSVLALFDSVQQQFSSLQDKFTQAIQLFDSLANAGIAILGAIPADVLPEFLVSPTASAIESAAQQASTQLQTAATQAAQAINNLATQVANQIQTIATQGEQQIDTFKTQLIQQLDQILELIQQQIAQVNAQIEQLIQAAVQQLNDLRDQAVMQIKTVRDQIEQRVDTLVDTTETQIVTLRNQFDTQLDAFNAQLTAAQQQVQARVLAVQQDCDARIAAVQQVTRTSVDKARGEIDALRAQTAQLVETQSARLESQLQSLESTATARINALGSPLAAIQSQVQSLRDGVQSNPFVVRQRAALEALKTETHAWLDAISAG